MNFLELELFSHTIGDYLALAPPVVVLGVLLGSLESTAFHVLFGRGDRSTLWYLVVGLVGFWLGHLAGEYIGAVLPTGGSPPCRGGFGGVRYLALHCGLRAKLIQFKVEELT